MEELLKVIAESIYLSNSENYLIAIASTNVKIIDLNDSSYQIIKLKDVQSVCMSDDDKYLFLCKYYSGTVYCYDIKKAISVN